ncbi:MAG: nitroreductase family protein [Aureliella sp.]
MIGKLLNYAIKGSQTLLCFLNDMVLYSKFSIGGLVRSHDADYESVMEIHKIEKGLSLPSPRECFGKNVVSEINEKLVAGEESVLAREMALGALQEYEQRFENSQCYDTTLIDHELISREGLEARGGTKKVTFPDLDVTQGVNFLTSRFSCRQYGNQLVPYETVKSIVATAQSAPSQCNRQGVRVKYLENYDDVQRALEIQGCAGGFSQDVRQLFIVCSDLRSWRGPQQRNQVYVDGALFSAGLIYACHAHKCGSCALNLAVPNTNEKRIKNEFDIPDHFRLIMLIAFGYMTESEIRVAYSLRRDVGEIFL